MEVLAGIEKRYVRTLEEAKAVINYAKLRESDLKQFTQPLYFSEKFEEFKLVELNTSVLTALTNGQKVVFRGEKDDKVVICTENETFEIKEAETSNSLLIVPDLTFPTDIQECKNEHVMKHRECPVVAHKGSALSLWKALADLDFKSKLNTFSPTEIIFYGRNMKKSLVLFFAPRNTYINAIQYLQINILQTGLFLPDTSFTILGICHMYYELRTVKSRLKKLWTLLYESRYRGSELEYLLEESNVKLHTMDSLLEVIQASNMEIENGLKEIGACCLNGYWRILDFDYCFRTLSYFLNLLDENSWKASRIPVKEAIELLKDIVPTGILEHIISQFSQRTGVCNDNGDFYYSLNEDKVCRFLAEALLRSAGRFNLQDFLQTWQESVPEGLQTNLCQLKGLALVDLDTKPQVIWYYPETDLPEDINERIQALFRTREKWTLNEIEPYIERLTTDKINVNAILTKYTRASNINGQRYYSARHGR